jgi:F0F1-type ATP synthase membrane subunit c/vacuolar-type H+-ATPase subunit K
MRGATEPLCVLVVEMLVFSLGAVGVQLAASEPEAQPPLLTTCIVGLVLSSAVLAGSLALYGFWEDADPVVFVMVRAAWQWALQCSCTAKVYATLVLTSRGATRHNWSALLLQTQTYEEQNYYVLTALLAVGLAAVSVVAMLQTVFYNHVAKGVQAHKNHSGRFAEMLAFSALLVQYSTERELARLCKTGQRPLDVAGCRLDALGDSAAADYGMLVPLGAATALMLAVDVGLVIVRARLGARASTPLVILYTLLAALPCVGFFVVVFVVLQHTELPFLLYLLSVGGLLVLARLQRVVYAVLKHGRDSERAPPPEEPAELPVSASLERVRIEGTAQRRAHKSKRQ